jgi:magnesium chelatase family protein
MNPCPWGYFGDLKRECRCGPVQVQHYRQRISGPPLDRIDLQIEVPAVEYRDVASERAEDNSTTIRERIGRAHERFQNDKLHTQYSLPRTHSRCHERIESRDASTSIRKSRK